jgi:hypothetical protein
MPDVRGSDIVLRACNPCTGEADTEGSQIRGQPGLQSETLS